MNYRQTLDYLFGRLPMYQRIGAAAYKPNLDNTLELCKILGNPERKFPSIHVAGTNGKGSVSHMMASVLQCSGLKTGLYTSPHLKDFRERIRINGKMIKKNEVVEFVKENKPCFEKINPSFFEMTVALAFHYFAREKVDVAVIEVGLGGRLDSTNVITPLLSVITNISFDHTFFLGNTLEKIAWEKAGIIKHSGLTLIGERQKEVEKVFIKQSAKKKSILFFADDFYKTKKSRYILNKGILKLDCDLSDIQRRSVLKNIQCDLTGLYQKKNIVTVLTARDLLVNFRNIKISEKQLRKGISNSAILTGLMGRWQIIKRNPLTIADTAHNEAGLIEVMKQIKLTPHHKLHFVFGMVNDKDPEDILKLLPVNATYYFCRANIARAMDENILLEYAKKFNLKGKSFHSVKAALRDAEQQAGKKDLVFIGGSTFVVAEVL